MQVHVIEGEKGSNQHSFYDGQCTQIGIMKSEF